MRAGAVVLASSLLLASASGVARAESGTPEAAGVMPAYTYEIENADARADKVLVVWPRACNASGEPLGAVDLALNPDWASRANDVDYEVITRGTHEVSEDCLATSQLYALPADAFPRNTRIATADDTIIGQADAGASFPVLPALDAVDRRKRIEFFTSDPRVMRSSFRFDLVQAARAMGKVPLAAVHDIMAVEFFDAAKGTFVVVPKHAIYTYKDGRRETIDYDAGALLAPRAATSASGGTGGANVGGAPPPAPSHDLGTRWVLLAALGGLVAGGLLALRNKRPPKK